MKEQKTHFRKPPWLKTKLSFNPVYAEVKNLIKDLNLHTVCQEANCPNIGECFSARTATFMILGDKCTRNCRFCDVNPGHPLPPDYDESRRVARAVKKLRLKYAVITSVTRDDLPDGGAAIFAETIRQIHDVSSDCKVEILIPDLGANTESMNLIISAKPEVIAHNIETVNDLYSVVRPQADYARSLHVLSYLSGYSDSSLVKSGIMVGLGEDFIQIKRVLQDAVGAGCKIFTVGQYLSPSKNHLPIKKYYTPEEFEKIKITGEKSGIQHMESGPLVRSSYLAHKQVAQYYAKNQAGKTA